MNAQLRNQLGLPDEVHMPPDLSVPLIVPESTIQEWRMQDAEGSGEAAYALGKVALQDGKLDEARTAIASAAARGSPEAAYALFAVAAITGASEEEIRHLLERADHAGSAAAAFVLAGRFQAEQDEAAAKAAADRALQRAQVGDANGSADAALVLAYLAHNPDQQRAAIHRAFTRGSDLGAFHEGALAERDGDLDTAMEAYLLAVRRGQPRAALQLGDVLAKSGRRWAGRNMWAQARKLAIATEDQELFAAAHAKLVPPLRAVLSEHRAAVAMYLACLVGLLATGNWRWVITVAMATGVLGFYRYRPVKGAMFTPVDGDPAGNHALSARGISVSARLAEDLDIMRRPAPITATSLDVLSTVAGYTAYLGFVVAVGFWSAGRLSFTEVLAWLSFAAAVVIVIQTVQSLPRALRRAESQTADTDDPLAGRVDAVDTDVKLRILPFTNVGVRLGVEGPGIATLVDVTRAARPALQSVWEQRAGALLSAAAALTGAAVLALPVVAPDRSLSLKAAADLAETIVVAWLLVVCFVRVSYAVRHRRSGWAIAATLYAGLAIGVSALGAVLGVWEVPDISSE